MKPWNLNGSKVFSCPFGERYPLPYPLAAKRPFYVPFHPVRAVSLHLLRYMTVYVQGKGRRCVAQVALDGFCIVPVLERQHRVGVPIQYNKDKSEKPRKIKGLSDLSLFFFHLFSIKNRPKTKGQKERCYINDKSEL